MKTKGTDMPDVNATSKQPRNEPNSSGRAASAARGYSQRPRSSVDWDQIDQSRIGLLVHAVTKPGAAIMFGRTSDGGALSVTVLDGDNRIREWPRSAEDFEALFAWLVGMFSGD